MNNDWLYDEDEDREHEGGDGADKGIELKELRDSGEEGKSLIVSKEIEMEQR